jgi:ribosomal protein L7Ae-like RNA K-turn-binding protein
MEKTFHLMKKARALISGTHAIDQPIAFMWIATDASDTRKDDCMYYCNKYKIPYAITGTKAFYSQLMGYPNIVVVRLINAHFLPLVHVPKEDKHDETQS